MAILKKMLNALLKTLLLGVIQAYRMCIRPFLGYCCRFEPSCSAYALQAITVHGNLKGCYFAVRRILRCHPWHPGGIDHVPAALKSRD